MFSNAKSTFEFSSASQQTFVQSPVNIDINLSGRAGQNGAVGNGYGAHGGCGEQGQAGTNFRTELKSYQASDGRLVVSVEAISGDAKIAKHAPFIEQLRTVTLKSRGGNGGHGGAGKEGSPGQHGSKGADASQFGSAQHGQRGDPGGPGGNGGDGAAGGPGGKIEVWANEDDLDLLSLLHFDVSGGNGGKGGPGGAGGKGGHGGAGGNSHTWTTTEKLLQTPNYIPGNDCVKFHFSPAEIPDLRDLMGSPGINGRDHAGQAEPGSVTFKIFNKGTSKIYPSRYSLSFSSYELTPAYDDGVIEPGEVLKLTSITLQNNGVMPSPGTKRVGIRVSGRGDANVVRTLYTVPTTITGGSSCKLKLGSKIKIAENFTTAGNRPYESAALVHLGGELMRARAAIPGTERSIELKIKYPIEIARFRIPAAIDPGATTPIAVTIKNVSKLAITCDDLAAESRRNVVVRLMATSSDADLKQVYFVNAAGKRTSLDRPLLLKFPSGTVLAPGAPKPLGGCIEIGKNVPSLSSIHFSVCLCIDNKAQADKLSEVHALGATLRASVPYFNRSASNFLLVAGEKLTPAELATWRRFALAFGLQFDCFDSVREQGFGLRKRFGNGRTLLSDWNNKSIICRSDWTSINKYFLNPDSGEISTQEFFDAQHAKINLGVVSNADYPHKGMEGVPQGSPVLATKKIESWLEFKAKL